jgi:hypothetical protein
VSDTDCSRNEDFTSHSVASHYGLEDSVLRSSAPCARNYAVWTSDVAAKFGEGGYISDTVIVEVHRALVLHLCRLSSGTALHCNPIPEIPSSLEVSTYSISARYQSDGLSPCSRRNGKGSEHCRYHAVTVSICSVGAQSRPSRSFPIRHSSWPLPSYRCRLDRSRRKPIVISGLCVSFRPFDVSVRTLRNDPPVVHH